MTIYIFLYNCVYFVRICLCNLRDFHTISRCVSRNFSMDNLKPLYKKGIVTLNVTIPFCCRFLMLTTSTLWFFFIFLEWTSFFIRSMKEIMSPCLSRCVKKFIIKHFYHRAFMRHSKLIGFISIIKCLAPKLF